MLASAALQRLLATHSLVLGSSSSSRRAILQAAGVPYAVEAANIDEKALRRPTPEALVLALSEAKAAAILPRLAGRPGHTLLITCDQVVVHRGRILEKPESVEEARAFIAGYSRDCCSTVGGLRVTDVRSGRFAESLDVATVVFDAIPPHVVESLVAEEAVLWCAGALMVESPLIAPHVTRIEGGMDSVQGLGMATLTRLLLEVGGEEPL